MSKTLLKSTDYYRLTCAVDCENVLDFGILCWCIIILHGKVQSFYDDMPKTTGIIQPDAVTTGLRLVQYKEDFQKFRDKHPNDMSLMRRISAERDIKEMLDYLGSSIQTLTGLKSLF